MSIPERQLRNDSHVSTLDVVTTEGKATETEVEAVDLLRRFTAMIFVSNHEENRSRAGKVQEVVCRAKLKEWSL